MKIPPPTVEDGNNKKNFNVYYYQSRGGSIKTPNFADIKFYKAKGTYSGYSNYDVYILVSECALIRNCSATPLSDTNYTNDSTVMSPITFKYTHYWVQRVKPLFNGNFFFVISPTIITEGDSVNNLRNIREIQELDELPPFSMIFVCQGEL